MFDSSDPFDEPQVRLGMAYAASGSRAEAIAAYYRALHDNADSFGAHFLLGVAAVEDAQWEEAFRHFVAAIDRAPAHAEPYNNLGVVYFHQGDLPSARTCFERALSVRPRFADAVTNLGIYYLASGRAVEARTCFERAVALSARSASAYNNLGVSLFRAGQFDDATACFERSIALDAQLAAPLRNLAHIYLCKGQDAEAQSCYGRSAVVRRRAAYRLDPFDVLLPMAERLGAAPEDDAYEPDEEVVVYELDESDLDPEL